MNVHPYAAFNTFIKKNRKTIPFILASSPLDPETVHLNMEDTKKDIQDVNSNYLVSAPIPDKNLFDTADDKINYIKEFIQPYHSYSEYQTAQANLTSDIKSEARATTAVTATAFTPKEGIPTNPLSNFTEESSTFLSTHPPDKPKEDPKSTPNSIPSDFPRVEPSNLPGHYPTEKPTEESA